jgi:folate-binding protein YgfZ
MYQTQVNMVQRARALGVAVMWDAAPDLGAILATGPEVASFLQAQLSSDVSALAPGQGHLSARLDRRGSLVSWLHLLRLPDRGQPFPAFLLVLPRAALPAVHDSLKRHLVAEDVLLEDASADFQGLLLQGPGAADLIPDSDPRLLTWPVSLTGDPGLLVLRPGGSSDPVLQSLRGRAAEAGWLVLGEDESSCRVWHWLRVEAGLPWPGQDLEPGKHLLPETGLEQQVVSWTKGCYLGQEVVARIRTYGSVPRALRGLTFPELGAGCLAGMPAAGAGVTDTGGKKLGRWGASGWSATEDCPVALAYLDRDSRTPGRQLELMLPDGQTVQAEVRLLPFHSSVDRSEQSRRLHHRAVEHFSRGQDDRAVALLEEALGLDPANADAFEALGVILGRGERYHEAIEIFRRLEEVAPDEPMVHTNLSLFYMKLGDKQEAERQMSLATMKRLGDPDSGNRDQVEAAAREARQQEARRKRAVFAEVLELDPQDALALASMGQVCSELEQWQEAASYLARALAVQKDSSPLYLSYGKALQETGRHQEAAATYRLGVEVASRRGDLQPLREMELRLALLQGAEAAG